MKSIERDFAETVAQVKHALSVADESHFVLRLEASGRTHDGTVEIKISLGKYGSEVEGDSVEAVVDEYLRRNGWNKRHAPLALPAPRSDHEMEAETERFNEATRDVIESGSGGGSWTRSVEEE
jgi:hypothetical protein